MGTHPYTPTYVLNNITKTYLYNFDPLKSHFNIVKLRFTGVYIICLISTQNIDCGYSLEPPRRGGSNEYPQSMFWAEIRKISEFFYLKIFIFWWWIFSIYLNRHVYVMKKNDTAPPHRLTSVSLEPGSRYWNMENDDWSDKLLRMLDMVVIVYYRNKTKYWDMPVHTV